MANTYTLINSYTVGSGGIGQVDFTSIPSTYTDLLVKTSVNNGTNLDLVLMRFNSNSSSIYTQQVLRGTGTNVGAFKNTGWSAATSLGLSYTGDTTNTFSNNEYYIPNYAGSNYKNVSNDSAHEANSSTAYLVLSAGLFSDTTAITSINLISSGSNFAQYSTFYLYGISKS
jgi:hypothetical protein